MDECLGVISEYPCSWLNQTSWLLEIEFLRLHVGSWIKVEGPSLSGVGDQAGIFVDLRRTDIIVNSQQSELLTAQEKQMKMLQITGGKLTSSPEKY